MFFARICSQLRAVIANVVQNLNNFFQKYHVENRCFKFDVTEMANAFYINAETCLANICRGHRALSWIHDISFKWLSVVAIDFWYIDIVSCNRLATNFIGTEYSENHPLGFPRNDDNWRCRFLLYWKDYRNRSILYATFGIDILLILINGKWLYIYIYTLGVSYQDDI